MRKYDVFINCPFDSEYHKLFNALLFAVQDCGLRPRCALEIEDSTEIRINKITDIILECKLGIHDISRTELDIINRLPRFNMPLELGLFLGAKKFGGKIQQSKNCLILDKEKHRYLKFCSDISGQDIKSHNNNEKDLIRNVRNWIRSLPTHKDNLLPSGSAIFSRYQIFMKDIPEICKNLRLNADELIYIDYLTVASVWLECNNNMHFS